MKTLENTQTMTSLEIAELTGKQHNHLMRDIRRMEAGWEKVTESKFGLSTYKDATGRTLPCYSLTKTECLYVATKFNDEARAKLVLRWEELEREQLRRQAREASPDDRAVVTRGTSLVAATTKEILSMADRIIGTALREVNAGAEDTLTATQVAKTFNMTVWDFNAVLRDMGIIYRRHGRWNLSDDLTARDLCRTRTFVSYSLRGERRVKTYLTWTIQGLRFLNSKLGYPRF